MQLDRQNVDVNLHPIWMMRYWNEKWYKLKDELRKTMQSLQWKFKTTCSMRVGNSRLTFRWCKLNHRSYVEWNSNIFSLAFQEFWTYTYIEYRYLFLYATTLAIVVWLSSMHIFCCWLHHSVNVNSKRKSPY